MNTRYFIYEDVSPNLSGVWEIKLETSSQGMAIAFDAFAAWKKLYPTKVYKLVKRTEEIIVCTNEMVEALKLPLRDPLKDGKPGE